MSTHVDRHNTPFCNQPCFSICFQGAKSVTQALHAFQQLENSTASDTPESWQGLKSLGKVRLSFKKEHVRMFFLLGNTLLRSSYPFAIGN